VLLLIIASGCVGACVYVLTQVATQPERDRRSLVRRATRYGAVRVGASRDEGLSLRERVLVPASARLAGLVLRLNRR
jgi:hypothetical protein